VQKIIDVEFTYKVVAGRNYNLTRDNKVHKPYLAKFDKNGNKGRKHE